MLEPLCSNRLQKINSAGMMRQGKVAILEVA